MNDFSMNDFGLPERTAEALQTIFANHSKVKKVVLYGSRAMGNYKNGSDIDLTMYGSGLTFDDLSNIAGDIEESSIPYLVDLSIYEQLDHAKLKDHIERKGKVFYDRYVGWKTVRLGDVFKIGSSKRVLKVDWKDSGVPFYRGREITALSNFGHVNNDLFISEEYFLELSKKYEMPIAGDLLITAIGTIGNTYIVNDKDRFYFKDASVLWLHKTTDVSSEFVSYWFKSKLFTEQLDVGNGATVDTLSISKLNSTEISLPPLAEQQRIVAKLDAVFAEIDMAVALTEAKEIEVEKLKTTLLAAFLINDTTDWKTVQLGDVVTIARGGSPRPIKSYITDEVDGINWIKIGDTEKGKRYIFSTKQKIKKSGISSSRYVEKNNFLLSNSMSFGCPYILKINGCIHDGWLVLSNYENEFDIDYLYYLLSSAVVKNQFENSARGSTVRNLNIELVSKVTVSYPPLAEQQRIVAKLDTMFAKLETINHVTSKTKKNYQTLKSAILAQELQGGEIA